jgi:amino acid transporter
VTTSQHRHRRGPYHPNTERHQRQGRDRLRLRDATAMGVGGMIGGGIFSVLGVTIERAGHLAFACFLLAGALAMVTARSYACLSRRAGRSGGPYTYLRDAGHPELAAVTSWFLILGYVIALAVYSFTFGRYGAAVIGGGTAVARGLAIGVMAVFWLINTHGNGASKITEDIVVVAKLAILALITGLGLLSWSPHRLTPLAGHGVGGVVVGAASIFIAYEGFELLAYDYDDIDDPSRNVPRALYLSVAIVIGIYVVVTIGSQMLVSDRLIVSQREIAFATVGREALGPFGRWLATGAALLATTSAINATLFSTARLVRDLSEASQLPESLGRSTNGRPVRAVAFLAVFGAAFAMLPGIEELLAFGSVAFLGVFGLIDLLSARTASSRSEAVVSSIGAVGCGLAIVVVAVELGRDDPLAIGLIAGCTATVGVLRLLYRRRLATA